MSRVEEILVALRTAGWVVAIHNDYRLSGELMTFWLFTRGDRRWIKGEGMDDEQALEAALEDSNRPDVRGGLLSAKLKAEADLEKAWAEAHRLGDALSVAQDMLKATERDLAAIVDTCQDESPASQTAAEKIARAAHLRLVSKGEAVSATRNHVET